MKTELQHFLDNTDFGPRGRLPREELHERFTRETDTLLTPKQFTYNVNRTPGYRVAPARIDGIVTRVVFVDPRTRGRHPRTKRDARSALRDALSTDDDRLIANTLRQHRSVVLRALGDAPSLPCYVIVAGNPTDGFAYYGPFSDRQAANVWANNTLQGEGWWAVKLAST